MVCGPEGVDCDAAAASLSYGEDRIPPAQNLLHTDFLPCCPQGRAEGVIRHDAKLLLHVGREEMLLIPIRRGWPFAVRRAPK